MKNASYWPVWYRMHNSLVLLEDVDFVLNGSPALNPFETMTGFMILRQLKIPEPISVLPVYLL